ncbi:MAG TPA: DUF4350 domain-containing protein [Steroidobacteraceae bacterium]|jgi:hypothetical protein
MKQRVLMLVAALGALALSVTLLLRSESGIAVSRDATRPTSEEAGPNGYRGAFAWLTRSGIRAQSLQVRFDQSLEEPSLPPEGNLLIVSLPVVTAFRSEEFASLTRWLRAGNTLLVAASLSDDPDWAGNLSELVSGDLSYLTGLQVKPGGGSRKEGHVGLVPNRPHAYFAGVRELAVASQTPLSSVTMRIPTDGIVLALARDVDTGSGLLWTRSVGQGRIVVTALGSLFTDGQLGEADNARLFSNLVAANVPPGGVVLFDDLHQGLTAGYDPAKFYKDRRLYVTLAILVAVWLSWVLGATALVRTAPRRPAPDEIGLVRATGGFLARVVSPAAAAVRMADLFVQRVGGWDALARHPRLGQPDLLQLRTWYAAAQAQRRVPLVRLHNLIVKLEGQLSA